MIILHNNKNKIYLTVFLTAIVFVGLIITWPKFSVASQARVKSEPVSQEALADNSIITDLQNSFELGKLQLNELPEQILKAQKQQELLVSAKEYLNNKLSSSTASTTKATSTATTSIK